jgi:hypothetical protein
MGRRPRKRRAEQGAWKLFSRLRPQVLPQGEINAGDRKGKVVITQLGDGRVTLPSPPSPLYISHVQMLKDDLCHGDSLVIYPRITAKNHHFSEIKEAMPVNNFYLSNNNLSWLVALSFDHFAKSCNMCSVKIDI